MKKSKFILSALLAGFLGLTSCDDTRDTSDIKYNFSSEVTLPKTVTSGRNQILPIKLSSDVYRDGVLEHEGVYIDDQKSFIISPKGDTIKPGQTFSIPHIDKSGTFNFYSEALGDHNLKFIFKNSKGVTMTEEHKVIVEKSTFKFTVKKIDQELTMDTPMDVEYFIEPYDELKHSYKLKFEVEGNYNATLNGHKPDEWFDVFDTSGKLTYIPLTVGTHKVRVTSKNNEDTKKVDYFTVVSKGPGVPVIKSFSLEEPLIIRGRRTTQCNNVGCSTHFWNHHVKAFLWKLYAHSGNNKEYLKGKIEFLGMGEDRMVYNFEMTSGKDQILALWYIVDKHNLPDDDFLTDGQLIDYKLELENTDGRKTIHRGSIPVKLEYGVSY